MRATHRKQRPPLKARRDRQDITAFVSHAPCIPDSLRDDFVEQQRDTFDPRIQCESAGERLFSVGIQGRGIHLILVKRGEDLSLNFSVPAKHQSLKDAVRRIFENPKFGENIAGTEYVSVAFNPAKDAVARMLVELLVQGFGVLEGEQLMFVSYERVEEKGRR
jgi:hypothetical protein